jgi:hypothetical protein
MKSGRLGLGQKQNDAVQQSHGNDCSIPAKDALGRNLTTTAAMQIIKQQCTTSMQELAKHYRRPRAASKLLRMAPYAVEKTYL